MMNVDRREMKAGLGSERSQQMQQDDGIDSAGQADRDTLPSQIVRAEKCAHGRFSARRFP